MGQKGSSRQPGSSRPRSSPDTRETTPQPPKPEPTVVGIGASAGGLAALRKFFDHVPDDSGLAFVVVVHLSPDHRSHLADLLQAHVKIPVRQVAQTTKLEPNHVYVIPPGSNLSAIDTHLRLSELEKQRRERAPIDHFFRTLAATHDGRAIGVILTGTGSDGTLGIKDIKAKGGLILAQEPSEAEYDGMPQSAIATGMVDLILPVEQIPAAVLRFARTKPQVRLSEDGEEVDRNERRYLHRIFGQLRGRTGRDFSRYKPSTMMRRIARRMQLNHIEELSDYVQLLGEKPAEIIALADDLLVTVTSFLRDPDVFAELEREVIPRLMRDRAVDDSVRVWSVGCATGEEAYSLTILLMEEAARQQAAPQIQVFASDLHQHSLVQAREGFYPGDIETDVSAERLRRFFEKVDGGYRIRKEVRERVVFAPHNLLSDPPFSRLDMICCRNLLIYLQREVQRDVIELFHYSLKPDGYLLLGISENVDVTELFLVVDKKQKIHQRRNVPAPEPRLPVFPLHGPHAKLDPPSPMRENVPVSYGMLHQRLVERHVPPSVLVTPDYKVVHLSEHAGRFLVQPGGVPTWNVFKIVREELRGELRTVLHAARQGPKAISSKPIPVQFNGEKHPVVMHVWPALDPGQEGFALVIFDERDEPEPAANLSACGNPSLSPNEENPEVRELEVDLELSRQRLQAVIEEYETSQEEMKASNEELQSANEELRSTMEELETSKEELQSMNEELQTANQENRHKVEELALLTGDLQNLLVATDIATLFLDRDFCIVRATPKLSKLFNVRMADRGRPISHFTHRLGYNDLLDDAKEVLRRLIPVEREVQDEAGRWYLVRVLPYRSMEDRIEGIVMTFLDITARRRAEVDRQAAEQQLAAELAAMKQLHELDMRLLVCTDLRTALDEVLTAALQITGGEMGTAQLLNRSSNALEIVTHQGFKEDFLDYFRSVTAEHNSACARVMQSGKQVVIEDVQADPLYSAHREIAASAGYRAVQSTPLTSRSGETLGVLATHYPKPHRPSDRELQMLDLYARQAADWIEHVRNRESLRKLNETLEQRVEERTRELIEKEERVRELASRLTMTEHQERHRLAQILHDNLQQLLYSINLKLSFLRDAAQSGRMDELLETANKAEEWIQEAVKTTQQLSVDLSPPVLRNEGLIEALRWLAAQMQQLHGLQVEITTKAGLKFSKSADVLLFQTLRELLFNVVKHAEVKTARVDIRKNREGLAIQVTDHGRGFDVRTLEAHHGFGVLSVQHRLSLLGGEMKIESEAGKGTMVSIHVPRQLLEEAT